MDEGIITQLTAADARCIASLNNLDAIHVMFREQWGDMANILFPLPRELFPLKLIRGFVMRNELHEGTWRARSAPAGTATEEDVEQQNKCNEALTLHIAAVYSALTDVEDELAAWNEEEQGPVNKKKRV